MIRKIFFVFFTALSITYGQEKPAFLTTYNKSWVDSIFQTMTLDQKIGQLLMPRGNFSGKPHDIPQLKEWVTKYKIGGIVFFAGNPTIQVDITNELQAISEIPLWIGQDFEWGTAMRLDSTVQFPYALTLGAYNGNPKWLEFMGQELGRHCNRLGVHINYAPVVDINSNPLNPVINFRSFGENRDNVSQKALAIWKGMSSKHVLCTAKHFPGHGDTQTDSHLDLPLVNASKSHLTAFDLYPFKQIIDAGIPGIMSAHIHVPAFDDSPNLPATLSRKIIHDLLRKQMGFDGLVFTDAMDMQGVIKHHEQGEAIVMALLAGNDVIETFLDVPLAVQAIKEALAQGRLTGEWLDFKVKKILKAKSWVGLDRYVPIPRKNLVQDLRSYEAECIVEKLFENSITLIKNNNLALPIENQNKKIVVITLGSPLAFSLPDMLNNYAPVQHLNVSATDMLQLNVDSFVQNIPNADQVLVAAFFSSMRPTKNYGINAQYKIWLETLANQNKSVLLWFGNPYGLDKINWAGYQALLCGYEDAFQAQNTVGQVVFGTKSSQGSLPVSLTNAPSGTSLQVPIRQKLAYGFGDLSMHKIKKLYAAVDSMMNFGLKDSLFPGAAFEVIYRDQVIIQKAYGSPIYMKDGDTSFQNSRRIDNVMDVSTSGQEQVDKNVIKQKKSVQIHDVYDLASLTKILGSALVFMKWVDEGKISVDDSLATYFPEWKSLPIGSLTFRDLLTHRSGLPAWIPFWKSTIDSSACLQIALKKHPELATLCVYEEKKPFFIWRWFGKKATRNISYEKTIQANNPALWTVIFDKKDLVWNKKYYSPIKTDSYSIKIRDSLWLINSYDQEIFRQIIRSTLQEKGRYLYSDLHFYFYPALCKRITGKSLHQYLDSIYKEMGLYYIQYLPLSNFDLTSIIPTEFDSVFRKSLIHGTVHDEGAIMMGGVSGHAGLFSDVNDVSKLLHLYLKGGRTGNSQVIQSSTLEEFTKYQFLEEKNRRALFFDKKDPVGNVHNAPALASPSSFGHSGFTGTYAWVDPEDDLVMVFLSNRVYPTRNNGKINQYLFRQKLCDEVYKILRE